MRLSVFRGVAHVARETRAVRRSRLQGRSLAASAALDERCERCLDVALVVGIVPDELLTYRLRRGPQADRRPNRSEICAVFCS